MTSGVPGLGELRVPPASLTGLLPEKGGVSRS